MDFKNVISEAYEYLGYEPRNGQEKIIESILTEFLTNGKQNVILSADTGIGKSIIGAVVSECIKRINSPELTSITLMHQNSLAKQYSASFHHMPDEAVFQIKGATNYPCNFMREVYFKPDATGEDCVAKDLTPFEAEKYCTGCEYKHAKSMVNNTDNLITNYSYFFISKLYTHHVEERELQIFDEAHVLNEAFCEHTAIVVSVDRLSFMIKELGTNGNGKFEAEAGDLAVHKAKVEKKLVNELNYITEITELGKVYKVIGSKFGRMSEAVPDKKDKIKFRRLSRKYVSLHCKIADFITHQYEHVFDSTVQNEYSIRSIFINDMMKMILGKYNLFMSATISRDFAETTYGLDHDRTVYIEAPQVFPSSNRPLLFIGKTKLNYQNMQDPDVVSNLQNQVSFICKHHFGLGDKGIILVPSFKLGAKLAEQLDKTNVYEHKSGQKIADVMEEFRHHTGPGVLISPSIYEGLDFKGDMSRFQIIVKTPYPSLGDKRISYISQAYPEVYRELALLKIIQGIGRSIRSVDDTAVTYFTDASSKQLYDSRINVWKNRFVIKS